MSAAKLMQVRGWVTSGTQARQVDVMAGRPSVKDGRSDRG